MTKSNKKRRALFFICGIISLFTFKSCSNTQSEYDNFLNVTDSDYRIEFTDFGWKDKNHADTLLLHFKIVDKKDNKKIFLGELNETDFKIYEPDKRPRFNDVRVISDQNSISRDAIFSLVVDRSKTIPSSELEKIRDVIRQVVDNLPDSTVYISFMDEELSEAQLISRKNFDNFEEEFYVSGNDKNLYQGISDKFIELSGMNIENQNDQSRKYLFIFTDGKVDPNQMQTITALDNFLEQVTNADMSLENNKIIINTFRYGNDDSNDKELMDICIFSRVNETQGDFFPVNEAMDVIPKVGVVIDNLKADYELILTNPPGKIYYGSPVSMIISIEKEYKSATGEKKYVIGSKERPVTTGADNENNYIYILWGIIILFLAFFIMQVVIPYINHKVDNFEKKYVKAYHPRNEGDIESCFICQEQFSRGEKIVEKCIHKTHWECWKENDYKCIEYGQNCSKGIQHYFDKDHPFDLKKSPYYLKWVLLGMVGGLITWIIYNLCFEFNPFLFEELSEWLLNNFYKGDLETDVQFGFSNKIGGFLLTGILLGFTLTFLFGYINEYRRKNGKIFFFIFLRAVMGAFLGFLSFLIGSIICIYLNAYANNPRVDWIPWLLFGASIALCLSVKTSIKWQHALIGGIISGVLSFIILYSTNFFGSLGVMLGFMLCSAGLGISIVTVHHTAQKYFLRYKHEKREGEIAIHKWMSVLGGSNEVTIGRSNNCVIQMNWDNSENIQDKQAKLYIDKKRNVPILKVLESDMIYDGREAKPNNEYMLKDGVKFEIGNTEFKYIEKK